MKTYFYLVFIVLTIVSCTSYSKFLNSDISCDFNQTIPKDEFTINTVFFDSVIASQNKYTGYQGVIYYEDEVFKKGVKYRPKNNVSYSLSILNKKKSIKKRMFYDSIGRLYNSEFKHVIYNYANVPHFLNIGTEYTYNPLDGSIKKMIDHRQADLYPICYVEALAIVKGLKPTKHYISSMRRGVKKSNTSEIETYFWEIGVKEPNDPSTTERGRMWVYIIDATTGELLRKMRHYSNPS